MRFTQSKSSIISHQPRRSLPCTGVFQSLGRSIKGVFSLDALHMHRLDKLKSMPTRPRSVRRWIQKVFASIDKSYIVFGFLPAEATKAGGLISDYAALFSLMPNFNRKLSQFHTNRPGPFPDLNKILFGEDSPWIPLSSSSLVYCHSTHIQVVALEWLIELRCLAKRIKPSQTLVVLLLGHSSVDSSGEFQLHVTDGTGRLHTIKAGELGVALKPCLGKIIILSDSETGALESGLSETLRGKEWLHLCAAHSTSGSRYPDPQPQHRHAADSTNTLVDSASELLTLSKAFIKLRTLPYSPDTQYARFCEEIIKRDADPDLDDDPTRYLSWEEHVYTKSLRSRHVQTIALQDMARRFGWWDGGNEVCNFLPSTMAGWLPEQTRMMECGMPIDHVALDLRPYFANISTARDVTATFWFVEKWVKANRPQVPLERWKAVLREAAEFTVNNALISGILPPP